MPDAWWNVPVPVARLNSTRSADDPPFRVGEHHVAAGADDVGLGEDVDHVGEQLDAAGEVERDLADVAEMSRRDLLPTLLLSGDVG